MPKLATKTAKTAYWNSKNGGYYFDRSAQAVLDKKYRSNRKGKSASACSSCSCGIGGCGDGGGCDG